MACLSIIMPVLDEGEGIAGALDALAELRGLGVEVIVVDGGSHDATVQRARLRADQVLTAPSGRALQMNAGAAKAAGDVLLFLHADTALPGEAERLVLDGLARSGRGWGRFDVTIDGRHPMLRLVAAMMNLRSRLTGIATGDQAIFVKRDTVPGGRRLSRDCADGGHRAVKAAEAARPAALPARARHHLRPPLGNARCISHDPADVAAATRTFFGADPAALAGRYRYGGG